MKRRANVITFTNGYHGLTVGALTVTGDWTSHRPLLRHEEMGCSFHDTTIRAGTETCIWYKNQLEAVYCVAGGGEIEDLETGQIHPIGDGTLYALNGHERHCLRAREDMRMSCVFNPPSPARRCTIGRAPTH